MDDRTRRTVWVAGCVGVVLTLFLVVAIGAGWYWYHTRSPRYSLSQAKQAAEAHDLPTFEKYVDIRGVSRSIVDQSYQELKRDQKPAESDLERAGRAIGGGLAALIKPRLADELAAQIAKSIEAEPPPPPPASGDRGFHLGTLFEDMRAHLHFKRIEYERRHGNTANVGLVVRNEKDEEILLDLKMRERDGYWQVAEITNVGDIIRAYGDRPGAE